MDFTAEYEYDVVVAGGGIAGVAAALAAAEQGARVAIVEKTVFWGGLATTGLIYAYLQLCDGKGTQVSFGLAERLLQASIKYGPGESKCDAWAARKKYSPEMKKYETEFSPASFIVAMDELLENTNITCHLDTLICAVNTDSDFKVESIEVENEKGRSLIRAKAFVDATGSAEIVKRAGGKVRDGWNSCCIWECHLARNPQSIMFGKVMPVHYCGTDYDIQGFGNGVTDFIMRSRKLIRNFYAEKYSTHEFNKNFTYPVLLPAMPQYRKIRCIEAKSILKDGQSATYFEDSIGMAGDWRGKTEPWEIPFSTLVPEKIKGVFAAGRCTAAENDEAWEITRVIPTAAVTGEAAGIAAAFAAEKGTPTDKISFKDIQDILKSRGIPLHLTDVGLNYK